MDQPSTPQIPNGESRQQFSIPMAILLAGFVIAVAVMFSSRGLPPSPAQSASPVPTDTPAALDARRVNTQDEPVIGKADAPLVMAYWSDYQCPFCKQFEITVLPTLLKNYVDTGKMKIIFKDFAFLGPDSTTAGLLSESIWHLYPKDFLAWNQAMFETQGAENSGWASQDNLMKIVKTKFPDMDTAKLTQDIAQNKTAYLQHLSDDETEAQKYSITGTPGFIVGSQQITGAEPLSYFAQVIDEEYQKAVQGK